MRDVIRMVFLLCVVVACAGTPDENAAAQTEAPSEEIAPAPAPTFLNAVAVGNVLAGGQPTREELAALAEQGYSTVINMRMPEEDSTTSEVAEELGLRYISLPINGSDGLTEENAIAFAELLGEVEGPTVVHCGSGNRVGALYALKAFYVDGMSAEEALEVGREAGMTRLEGAVAEQLGAAPEPPADG